MAFFVRNGELLPEEQAVEPLSRIEFTYGFGVYETIRVVHGTPRFIDDHLERLLASADGIGLDHHLDISAVRGWVDALIQKNELDTANLKLLLIGGRTAEDATLTIQSLAPFFPDRTLYRDGAHAITVEMERPFPQAKSLNMLPSYLAYRDARAAGAYDALLVNRSGHLVEGTRTNVFVMKGKTIISPPEEEILLGVARKYVLHVARNNGYTVELQPIVHDGIAEYDAAFVTSTSSKIMPLRSVNDHLFGAPTNELRELGTLYNDFLRSV